MKLDPAQTMDELPGFGSRSRSQAWVFHGLDRVRLTSTLEDRLAGGERWVCGDGASSSARGAPARTRGDSEAVARHPRRIMKKMEAMKKGAIIRLMQKCRKRRRQGYEQRTVR